MTLSVVVPTYNERENIAPLIAETLTHLPKAEVIVVDDDSPDGTAQVVRERWGDDPRVRLIVRVGRRGLPSALAEGVEAARGDVVAWMDSDFNMPPAFLLDLLRALDEADVAVASRYVPGGEDGRASRLRVLASRVLNLIASCLLGFRVRDYTSGLLAARREVFARIRVDPAYRHGEYCIDFLARAHRAGFRVREIPFRCLERRAGETKTAPTLGQFVVLGVAYLAAILKLALRREASERPGPGPDGRGAAARRDR